MAAPEYVPVKPMDDVRTYESPPRRSGSWRADRPGDLHDAGQPRGDRLGSPGPDQGYALKLARQLEGKLTLGGLSEHDVVHGCLGVALKRASLFGRAPVIHDLTVAFTVWGFLDDHPAPELVAVRAGLFEEVANPNHYGEQRAIVDAVPDETLRLSHGAVAERHAADWRALLDLPTRSHT